LCFVWRLIRGRGRVRGIDSRSIFFGHVPGEVQDLEVVKQGDCEGLDDEKEDSDDTEAEKLVRLYEYGKGHQTDNVGYQGKPSHPSDFTPKSHLI
jgi:hypothetical protein